MFIDFVCFIDVFGLLQTDNIFLSKGNTVIRISFQRITTTFNVCRSLIISNEELDFEEFFRSRILRKPMMHDILSLSSLKYT